jgi:hypothetical protein
MAKIVVKSVGPKAKPTDGRNTAVVEKRVRDAEGNVKTLRTLDVGSATFGDDLLYVFKKNVAKARRDNKRITGSADSIVRKG